MEPPTVQKNKIECKMTFRNEEPHVNKCFPRIRGDVPCLKRYHQSMMMFSPHTRGCSAPSAFLFYLAEVFPAYAGMFPERVTCGGDLGSFPRIRGDVPNWVYRDYTLVEFSPHTRGCS